MSDLSFIDSNAFAAAAESSNDADYSPLPNGWYTGRVTEIEVRDTKAGNGKYVNLRLDIEGPTHAGRVIYDMMMVAHPNPTAVEIGMAKFAGLCKSAGMTGFPKDTKELLGRTVGVKLKIEKSSEYGDKNRMVAFKAAEGAGIPTVADSDIPF